MLRRLDDIPELASVWRMASWCYSAPSDLHVFRFNEIVAQRESRQGCVLGCLLFCIAIQPLLTTAVGGLQNTSLAAYVDDLSLAGPIDEIRTAFARINVASPKRGLELSAP